MNEYIIINKSDILKRIEELVKESNLGKTIPSINCHMAESLIRFKEEILSQSVPLIPEIEKAFDAGNQYGFYEAHNANTGDILDCDSYISNLKLEI